MNALLNCLLVFIYENSNEGVSEEIGSYAYKIDYMSHWYDSWENGLSESSYYVGSEINLTNPSVILWGSLISLASNAISHVLPREGVGQERLCACHMTSHLLPRYSEWVELDHMLAMWPHHSLSGIFTCYLNIGELVSSVIYQRYLSSQSLKHKVYKSETNNISHHSPSNMRHIKVNR